MPRFEAPVPGGPRPTPMPLVPRCPPLPPHLQDGEVLQDAVHHVFLWQVLQLVDKVDHVLAHGRAVDAVHKAPILQPGILGLREPEGVGRGQASLGLPTPSSLPPPQPHPSLWPPTHLHLLHYLLAKGAHLGGDTDGHAIGRAVLGADPIEGAWALLDGAVEVGLEERAGQHEVLPEAKGGIQPGGPSPARYPQAQAERAGAGVGRAGPGGTEHLAGSIRNRGERAAHPELDKEEGVGGPLLIELLQATLLLGELVVYLTHIHCLQGRV